MLWELVFLVYHVFFLIRRGTMRPTCSVEWAAAPRSRKGNHGCLSLNVRSKLQPVPHIRA